MNILGWIVAVFGFAGIVFALRMMMKGKKMSTVPFRKPSEIVRDGAAAADPKGMVSTEGKAAPIETLIAPMSGQPCLAYELKIERKWEQQVQSENGTSKKTGSDTVHEEYHGSVFQISDSDGGAVKVDLAKKPEASFEKGHSSTIKVGLVIPGSLQFGQLTINTPTILNLDSRTTAFVGTETVIKPADNLYALGALTDGVIAEPKGAFTGKLTLSNKGREQLLRATRRNMILGYAIGGVLALGGSGLGLFGPKHESNVCHDFTDTLATCSVRVASKSGESYSWTVTQTGRYTVEAKRPSVKNPIWSEITITDGAGNIIAHNDEGGPTTDATVTKELQPGTYKINVRDSAQRTVNGGFNLQLAVSAAAQATAPKAVVVAQNDTDGDAADLCQRAVVCCEAVSGKGPACGGLARGSSTTCRSSLDSMRRAANAIGKKARAACQ